VLKTYIISLINSGSGDHQRSAKELLSYTQVRCQHYNWNTELFTAVNGYNLDESIWQINGLKIPKKSSVKSMKFGDSPGSQGCFLSHYTLWNRCIELAEPIIIFEDDAEVIAPLPDINTNCDVLKLHGPRRAGYTPKVGNWGIGAFAYWVSPEGAKKLVEFSKQHAPSFADKLIGSNIVNWDYLSTPIVKLGPRIGSSTQPEKYPYRFKYNF
jgi:GR25 family glycosyltransferase involved in LPS biosynthesis